MTAFQRMIFDVQPDNLITAGRAARWLLERPEQVDAILAYGEGKNEVSFYVRRNRASISIREQPSSIPSTHQQDAAK